MDTRFENSYVLNVMADDHPGIVAAVGGAVQALEGSIDACSQTVLRGYFTLIMVVRMPREVSPEALSAEVFKRGADLQVMVRRFDPAAEKIPPKDVQRFVVTAFGRDEPGVIYRFTQYLAGKDINIVDLYGYRSGDQFMLVSQVDVPARWEIAMLQADLEQMGRDSSFTVRLQHEDIFVATNQLRLSRKEL